MSIASRITSMENNIRNAYHGLDSIGIDITNKNKNIENISTLLEDFYDSLPKVSGTGSILSLNPTLKGRLGSILKGNTLQDGTPTPSIPVEIQSATGLQNITVCGKNLINKDNSISYTISSSSGTIYYSTNRYAYLVEAQENTTYTFSRSAVGTSSLSRIACLETFIPNETNYYIDNINLENNLTETFTTPAKTNYIMFLSGSGESTDIMLEYGSTATTYEPYQSQEYEINLGKNLFDKNNANSINAYIDSGSNAIYTTENNKLLYIPIIGGKTYTVSKVKTDRFTIATTSVVPANNVSTLNLLQDNNATSLTITAPSNAKYLAVHYYRYSDTLTPQQILDTIQIEVGSQASSYSPYFTPIHLRKSQDGTYQDYITGTPNNWSIKRQIGSVVLDGSENWQDAGTNRFNIVGIITDYLKKDGAITYICNNYQAFEQSISNSSFNTLVSNVDYGFNMNSSTGTDIRFKHTGIDNVNDYKSWLSNHNTIVDYVLATETTEPITNTELIEDLNNLYYAKSYNGTTNITITSADLELIMTASALKGE